MKKENKFFDKCISQFYKIISKKDYLNKRLIEITEKKKRYLSMTDDQFLTVYIELHSNFERKKTIFTVILVGLMLSFITNTWKYCFIFLQQLLLSEN